MASVCFYFQVHQPLRLRHYSVFDTDRDYFDDFRNAEICRKVATKCYLPVTRLLREMIQEHAGRFRVAFSMTGCAIEQFEKYTPDVIDSFRELAATGCVEFLSETYYHSLAVLFSPQEFREQVDIHRAAMKRLFNQEPRVFRNTELVYNNDLAQLTAEMGYDGILAEGADRVLGDRSCNFLYNAPSVKGLTGAKGLKVLLKNYRLSDDIAFRFSNRQWERWPLTAEKFAACVNQIHGSGDVCNLFMDLETFGEHQGAQTGIFDFLRYLPGHVMAGGNNDFLTPSQVIARYPATGEIDVPQTTSWADTERDVSAWLGNAMQTNAMHELFKIETAMKAHGDLDLLADWRMLTCSDHFYYMCTKYWADGDVHKYFSPYESPYDSYINFMNVLDNIRIRLEQ